MRVLTHGSLFAGIGGFDLGFERAGIKTVWMAEKEPFCRAVLRTHFKGAKVFNDVAEVTAESAGAVDIISFGFPCQDVSVAGQRAGLGGTRSGLFWEAHRVVGELRPTWFVAENVPGLFSADEGFAFASILAALDELGYGLAWRVFDSQFFGVAQRRERVFIVGCAGRPCPEAVLFESTGGEGSSPQSQTPGKDIAFCLAASVRGSGDDHGNAWNSNYAVARMRGFGDYEESEYAGALKERDHKDATDLIIASTLRAQDGGSSGGGPRGGYGENLVAHALTGSAGHHGHGSSREGEGLVVGATIHSDREGEIATLPRRLDAPRARALGNAVTASVAEWIGRRIIEAEENLNRGTV